MRPAKGRTAGGLPVRSFGDRDTPGIGVEIFTWRLAGNGFEYAVKVGDTVEAAVISHGCDAVISAVRQAFARLVDPDLIQETDKGVQRMFLKIPAKSLRGHMGLSGDVFQTDRLIELLHDIVVYGADADTFVFAVRDRVRSVGERCQFVN